MTFTFFSNALYIFRALRLLEGSGFLFIDYLFSLINQKLEMEERREDHPATS